jgi:hypothetical protein
VFLGKNIKAQALGKEDLLIMKCFAGRQKDIPHARALVKSGADIQLVEEHIRSLIQKRFLKRIMHKNFCTKSKIGWEIKHERFNVYSNVERFTKSLSKSSN